MSSSNKSKQPIATLIMTKFLLTIDKQVDSQKEKIK